MKFDYNDNGNFNDSQINYQISQRNNFRQSKKGSRTKFRYKRLKRLLVNFTLILAELLIIILIAFYFISPLNRVSRVTISGNRTILANSMVHDMKANRGNSVFRIVMYRNHLKKYAFRRNAQLKAIHVHFHKWNHVHVQLSEYPVVAYLHREKQYYAMTNNGQTAYQCTKPNQINPILTGFKVNRNLKSFIKYYELLPNSVKPDVEAIKYVPDKIDPNRIHVYMSDGNQIYANYKNWQHKMKYYSAISKSMKKRGTINMELGVYSKAFKP